MSSRRGLGVASLGAVAAILLAGCSAASSDAADDGATDPAQFVIDQDFPDPDVIEVDGVYYAYATNSRAVNVQFATSTDLETWDVASDDVFPDLPEWADTGRTWAPDVAVLPDGRFALYFTATDASSGRQCIGVAVSDAADGPFVSDSPTPLICPLDEGGAIDAASFVDSDGAPYLVWKNDGNCCELDTWLQLSPLTADGLSLAGDPVKLLTTTEPWEGTLIEAPVIVRHDGEYVLFYSANDYGGDQYATGYATAPSLTGPYRKAAGPLLTTDLTDQQYLGPGGQDIVIAPDGTDRIVFHSWDAAYSYRGMNVLELRWDSGKPVVG
ncbi:beta-xylosidase [Salinibacterium sp. CAN_S4]|uniref:glycoside hydrolase family 43 protein n=1 Tax=Salinibacterium sp. CAN_S4 TaxID=2787727 RepID=UPI0018EF4C10